MFLNENIYVERCLPRPCARFQDTCGVKLHLYSSSIQPVHCLTALRKEPMSACLRGLSCRGCRIIWLQEFTRRRL